MTDSPLTPDSTPPRAPGGYPESMVRELYDGLIEARAGLRDLQEASLRVAQQLPEAPFRDHLQFGVGRRAGYMHRILGNIFEIFPPDAKAVIPQESVADATINLHAFLMHLAGVWDNWAWAYLLRHDAAPSNPRKVGLFKAKIQRLLPKELKTWLNEERLRTWRQQHAFDNRDALAHRIPPYIPPALATPEQGTAIRQRLDSLNSEGRHSDALDAMLESASALQPCFFFLHEFTGWVYLHPQIISDARLVTEFGLLFLRHWENPPTRELKETTP